MTFRVIDIQVLNHDTRSQARHSLCVDSFLYYLFKVSRFSILLFYLNLNERLETFLEITDYKKLIRGLDKIEFCQDRLEVLKLGCPFPSFFQIILGVSSKISPNIVNKDLGIFKVFLKKDFKLESSD